MNRLKGKVSRDQVLTFWILFGVFLLFCIFGYLFPYVHDDWAWGSSIGMERLQSGFVNYNGRWGGNLLVLLLTRSRVLRMLSFGVSFASIAYFSGKLAGTKRIPALLFCVAVILCMPHALFAQAVSWTSGFANYTASLALVLPVVAVVQKKMFAPEVEQDKPIWIIVYMLVCFAGQLFIEHVTIYMLALCLFANILYAIRHKKASPLFMGLLLASAAGAALMFSNGAYSAALSGQNQYQQVATGGVAAILKTAAEKYFGTIYSFALFENLALTFVIGIAAILLIWKRKPKWHKWISAFFTGFVLYQLVRKWMPFTVSATIPGKLLEGTLCLVFLFCLLYVVWHVRAVRERGVFLIVSVVVLTGPLLIAEPVGARNFFVVYVFLTVLAALLCGHLLETTEGRRFEPRFIRSAAVLCALCACFYLGMFSYVHYADVKRLSSVREQIAAGETQLALAPLPFNAYMHNSSPISDRFTERFILFYGLPENVTLLTEK